MISTNDVRSVELFGNAFDNLTYKISNKASHRSRTDGFHQNPMGDAPIHKQVELFKADWKDHGRELWAETQVEALRLAKIVGTIVLAPLFLIADTYRCLVKGTISGKKLASNFVYLPAHILKSGLSSVVWSVRVANKIVTALSTGAGNLLWHAGEGIVNKVRHFRAKDITEASKKSILSDNRNIRKIVYQSLGITALAAVALFIPIPPIQIIALSILGGSIYGTINNHFTTRDCPEYYTMGHHYDGTHVRDHAVKSLNPNLKAVVAGCYATTMVTRIAGYIFAAAATVPFVAATVPLAISVAMVATSVILGLGVAHVLSRRARASERRFKEDVETFAKELNYDLKGKEDNTVESLLRDLLGEYYKKGEDEKERLKNLADRIRSKNVRYDVPLRYQAGWHANNTRNLTGYIVSGVGTLAAVVTTVCLRVLVF